MTITTRLRRAWDSVRPRTRRGSLLAIGAILASSAGLSVVLLVVGAMAWNPYVQYALDRESNARQWAVLELSYTTSGSCADCHAPQQAKLVAATHDGIGCQSCHGPLLDHADEAEAAADAEAAGDRPGRASLALELPVPTDEVCIRCHSAAVGRPADLRQIVQGQHYVAECLECHDPHTGVASRPPEVLHPRAGLPACLTCHGPDGFKARNQRHPDVTGDDDARCMECHGAGRGPDEDDASAQVTP